MSIQWLEYLSHTRKIEIKHAVNDGYQPDTKKCYEFVGCFYHRCVRCYAQAGLNPVTRETYGVLLGQFMSKVNDLKVRVDTVRKLW